MSETTTTCPRRRKLLAALGLVGVAAYAAPTLSSQGQAQAGDWDDGRWRIVYETHPDARDRRYVDDYREHRRRRHHQHHHHGQRHSKHSRHSHSRHSHSHPSRW
ncbi:hypothetical protein [Halomonas nitroreducens]|uniref:Twin-arginine translocation signal domain-containing protein n=1 Tax=Halomonas nitroreducens TaxID=447425 RepID=A0A3S0HV37_9GAMM|nr:hypothetical protein [Halomonas nitroreducens]RTR05967.1 hypothetical protein EKG36_04270 [Halomonas nitroreducens]